MSCSELPRLTVCCSVLQCVAVCCSVLQCVAVCCSATHPRDIDGLREKCRVGTACECVVHAYVSEMTYRYVCVAWFIYVCVTWHMHMICTPFAQSTVWVQHVSVQRIHMCVKELIHMSVWRDTLACVGSWLNHTRSSWRIHARHDATYMWHALFHTWNDSFTRVTWLIHTCDMTHSYECVVTHSCATWRYS